MAIILFIQVLFYGIIEGITEWLPVSSTGHLILFESIWPITVSPQFLEAFRVIIQLGAILAVCIIYFDRLNPFSHKKNERQKQVTWSLWIKIIVSVIPAGLIGILIDDFVDAHFYNWKVVAAMLIVYGVLFILIEKFKDYIPEKVNNTGKISVKKAIIIGLIQMLAVIPGTSRSGVTIIGSRFMGLSRKTAAEFSFFLAIPVMIGASGLKLIKLGFNFTFLEFVLLIFGMVVAFVVSMYAIKYFLRYIKNNDFTIFGYYRIALGILVIVLALIFPGLMP